LYLRIAKVIFPVVLMKDYMQICWVSNLQTFTAKFYFTVFLICGTQLALAQLTDNFSDDDFTASPPWLGDDSRFIVSNGQLKLDAPHEEGRAFLSTLSSLEKGAVWEFKLKMEFNPSTSNYTRVYLISDQYDLTEPLNGYFIQAGDSKDDVSLYKQEGTVLSRMIDGRDGALDAPISEIKVRVVRDQHGQWQLFTSLNLTENYLLEGSASDNTESTPQYFGFVCFYTATRSDKFFFDDFKISAYDAIDVSPPGLTTLEVNSSTELSLEFSEPLDPVTVTPQNFSVSPTVGNPREVFILAGNKSVILKFDESFLSDGPSFLTIAGIRDEAGNVLEELRREFLFVPIIKPDPKSVIITEIFADPSPPVGLPESEFVEIFNRSGQAFNLSGWKFTDQSSIATLPDFVLLPHSYVVLTSENSALPDSDKVLRLSNFASLNNGTDVLILRDNENSTVDSVSYSDSWYKNADKRNGGWTLEIIDVENICSDRENWVASEDDVGGTPGMQNSVFANKPDLTGPKLLSVIPVSPSEIQLQFDEKLESELRSDFSVTTEPFLQVTSAALSDNTLTKVRLSVAGQIQSGISYTCMIDKLYDCAGNPYLSGETQFGLPELPDSLDVLVNEILFNPRPTGVDFVEIVNTSQKFINLDKWGLASMDGGLPTNKLTISSGDYLLGPGDVLAITTDANIVMGEYFTAEKQRFLQVDHLPGFNDDSGSVALIDSSGNVIDHFAYSKDMHSIFIKDEEGVSLERISFSAASTAENWKSAGSFVGFATPGYANSNAFQESPFASALNVAPEIFNPLDGQNNFALIRYNFPSGGQVANVRIFDSRGHLIKELANNDVIGTSGFYRWDGDRSNGTKAGIGYYMIWFETFDDKGGTQNFRAPVAIAAQF
ncbi:MAG TPA: lamin tail domain-containing protein, partial [Chryseolinea sp.]